MSSRARQLEDLLPYLMNRLLARLNQNLAERLRREGYTFQDWRILAVLASSDGMTISALAEAAVIPQPTVSRHAARLVHSGLIRRGRGQDDNRLVEATITRRGRAAFDAMLPLAIAEYRAVAAGLPASETARLERAVKHMLRNAGVRLAGRAPRPASRRGRGGRRSLAARD
jgi:DNA-binding MarR family transcriptional regulator